MSFQFWLTLYATYRKDFAIKVEIDKAEDLKQTLLNSGYSIDVAEKIVAHYFKDIESV